MELTGLVNDIHLVLLGDDVHILKAQVAVYHILGNLFDGHRLVGLNLVATAIGREVLNGNHLLGTLILIPGCNSIGDEVAIGEGA